MMEQNPPGRAGMHKIRLRRDGGRPVSGLGCCLIEAGNWQPDVPFWQEVAIYQFANGRFAASLRTFFKSEGARDGFRAECFDDAAQVVAWLREHDPAHDLPHYMPGSLDDLHALNCWHHEMLNNMATIRERYASLLDEVLPPQEATERLAG